MKRGANVGSGQRRFTSTPEVEWVNIDKVSDAAAREGCVPDVIADAAKLPYEDNWFDYVVYHHLAEHFGCGEAPFAEAYRVLKPNGSLFVFVPDMKALAQRWLMGKMDDQLYFTNVYGSYHGYEEDRHKWGFTAASLQHELQERGFAGVLMFDWRVVPGMDAARDWWILAMEAVKK